MKKIPTKERHEVEKKGQEFLDTVLLFGFSILVLIFIFSMIFKNVF